MNDPRRDATVATLSAAQPNDVEKRWRPFEDEHEKVVCTTLLEDIHLDIAARFTELDRDLDAELAADAGAKTFTRQVVRAESNAVKRVMLNPELWRTESIDDWSATRDSRLDGELRLTPEDWKRLGVRPPADEDQGKAFVIDQTPCYVDVYDTPGTWRRRFM